MRASILPLLAGAPLALGCSAPATRASVAEPPAQTVLPPLLRASDTALLAAAHFAEALRCLERSDARTAALFLEHLAQDFPAHAELAAVHAWVLLESGETRSALLVAQDLAALAAAPSPRLRAAARAREQSAYVLGLALVAERRTAEALPWLQAAAPAAGTDRRLLEAAAVAALASGSGAAARAFAETLHRLDPDDRRAGELLARAELAGGSPAAAEARYLELLDADNEDPELWSGLGQSCFRAGLAGGGGGFERAARAFQEAVDLQPMNPEHRFRLGCSYDWERDIEAAAAAYRAALAVDPGCTPAAENLAALLQAQGQVGPALGVLREQLRQPLGPAERMRVLEGIRVLEQAASTPLDRVIPP